MNLTVSLVSALLVLGFIVFTLIMPDKSAETFAKINDILNSNFSWYAMLFSAGTGIGIFFYGVAEPIYHLNIPKGLSSGSQFDNFNSRYNIYCTYF